jgi:hypothetical protein
MNKITDLRKLFNRIKKVFKIFKIAKKQNNEGCVKYSINEFNKLYIYNINDLLSFYPPDKINTVTGLKF